MINCGNTIPLRPQLSFDNIPTIVFAIGIVRENGFELRGTCFRLDKPGFVATASHVVGRTSDVIGIVINEIDDINGYQSGMKPQIQYYPATLIAVDPIHDLAVLHIPRLEILGMATINVSGTDNISVGEDVVSFGYPHLDSGRKVLTRFDGKIGAKLYLPSPTIDVKYAVLNTLARPGQSGAPVFRSNSNELVAVLSGAYQPPTNGLSIVIGGADLSAMSQTTHAVSAEYLREMY